MITYSLFFNCNKSGNVRIYRLSIVILLGDFNFPDIDWSCPDISYEAAAPLLSLSNSLLLNQQVDKPTRLSNTLDLIFCPDELIKSISVADTYLSDHRILTTSTLVLLLTSGYFWLFSRLFIQLGQQLQPSTSCLLHFPWT